jgi:hypothetical protein
MKTGKKILLVFIILFVAAVSVGGYYFYRDLLPLIKQMNSQKEQQKEKTKKIEDEIKNLKPDKNPEDTIIPEDATEEEKVVLEEEKYYWENN